MTTTVQQSTVRLRTGVEMRYVEQGHRDATEVVVALHGWPDSWFTFSRVTPALAAGNRCIAVDQRGFGDSSRPATGYRIEDLAADAVAFLDALDLPVVTLVGHSMGTFVARRVAQLHPERVRGLVLIGSAVVAGNAVVREVAGLGARFAGCWFALLATAAGWAAWQGGVAAARLPALALVALPAGMLLGAARTADQLRPAGVAVHVAGLMTVLLAGTVIASPSRAAPRRRPSAAPGHDAAGPATSGSPAAAAGLAAAHTVDVDAAASASTG